MRKNIISVVLALLPSLHVFAGTMGTDSVSYAGIWGGIGGSYTSTQLNGNTTITTQPAISAPGTYIISSGSETHFAPVGEVGYLYALANDWLLGARVQYKYIGLEQFDIDWSGTLQNGAYQTGGIHSKLQDEWLFLLDMGYQFNQWMVYAGAGPVLFNASAQLNGDVLPAGSFSFFSVNEQNTKSLLGAGGHVGIEYMLPHRFMLNLSYDFAMSQSLNVPKLFFSSGDANYYSGFTQNLQAVEQGINLTVNKYFNL